ncbi:MAG: hypothetical protein QXM27_01350 [Candidatus Pacearchaeota archaeon]
MKNRVKKENKIINWKKILIWFIIFLLIIILTELIWIYIKFLHNTTAIRIYDIKLKVGDYIGFNIENESINFGTIMPGGRGERYIEVTSNKDVKVEIYLKGDIAKWIIVDKNDFILKKNTKENITFSVVIPKDAKIGNYTGKAIILFRKI